ncbi:MAG TPA: glycosyltransferase [Longimicrobiales bacterium]
MKLLFLNHNVVNTGTFFRAFHVGRHLVMRGHEVTVITTSRQRRVGIGTYERDGVRIEEMPDLLPGRARTGMDPWNTLHRLRAANREQWDLVYAFDSRPAVIIPALYVSRRQRIPLVMDWADWWGRGGTIVDRSGPLVRNTVGIVEAWFEERFRRDADATTVICQALEQRVTSLGVPASTILRYPMGCDAPADAVSRAEARSRLGVDTGARFLLHLGVSVQKDADLLFDAFRSARQQEPSARLVLVGNFRPATPPELEADGSVVRTGIVPDDVLRDWLAAADVCVLPMRDTIANRGRWPSKINDYFAAGRRVLTTRVSDAAAYVEAHGAGHVVAASVEGVSRGMLTLLRQTAADAAAGEAAALRLARTDLAWDSIMDDVEVFLKRACDHA